MPLTFPDELGSPCLSSFSETPQGQHKRVQFDAGAPRVRRRVRSRPNTFSLCYNVDLAGRRVLEQFHRTASGTVFLIQLPGPNEGDALVSHHGRFAGGLSIKPLGGQQYEMRFNLHMVDSLLVTKTHVDTTMALLLVSGAGFDQPLHTVIHDIMPGAFNER